MLLIGMHIKRRKTYTFCKSWVPSKSQALAEPWNYYNESDVIKTLNKLARQWEQPITVQDGEKQEVHCWTWCQGRPGKNDTLTLVSQLIDLKMDTVGWRNWQVELGLSCLKIFCVSQPLHWPHSTSLEHFSKVSLPQDLVQIVLGKEATLSFSPKHPLTFTYTLTRTHTLIYTYMHSDTPTLILIHVLTY